MTEQLFLATRATSTDGELRLRDLLCAGKTTVAASAFMAMVALGSPALASGQQGQPWSIKEFEVLAVEPMRNWGPFSHYGPDKNRMASDLTDLLIALARVSPVDFEALGARTIELDPTIKARMEAHLSKTADLLESWGFPQPRLDPVVETDGGRSAYRIFVLAGLSDETAGEYHGPLCSESVFGLERKTETIIQIDGRRLGNYRVGALGTSALTTLSHELFHAVQYATPFYEGTACEGKVGGWITEGTADAIGWDAVRIIGGVDVANNPDSWGARTYSRPLPVPAAYGGQANIKNRRYMTASFWRYLAEFEALGQPPGAAPGTVDYRSLSSFLSGKPTGRDCVGADDLCNAELAYLDQWLSGHYGGAQLRDIYAKFVGAYSLYGAYRLDAMYGNTADRIVSWQGYGFNRSCGLIELKNQPGELHKQEVVAIDDVAAECWNIEPQGFQDPVLVEVVASGPSPTLLLQLTAAVATSGDASVTGPGGDGLGSVNVKTMKARLLGDPQRGFRTRWVFEIDNGKETPFLLANVADEAEKTHAMQRVSVTFTALEEYVKMKVSGGESEGSGDGAGDDDGPTPADIAQPTPIDFDVAEGQFPVFYDEGVCLIWLQLRSKQEDALWIMGNLSPPITPGSYPIVKRNVKQTLDEVGSDLYSPRYNVGGYHLYGQSGFLEIESVSHLMIVGRVQTLLGLGDFGAEVHAEFALRPGSMVGGILGPKASDHPCFTRDDASGQTAGAGGNQGPGDDGPGDDTENGEGETTGDDTAADSGGPPTDGDAVVDAGGAPDDDPDTAGDREGPAGADGDRPPREDSEAVGEATRATRTIEFLENRGGAVRSNPQPVHGSLDPGSFNVSSDAFDLQLALPVETVAQCTGPDSQLGGLLRLIAMGFTEEAPFDHDGSHLISIDDAAFELDAIDRRLRLTLDFEKCGPTECTSAHLVVRAAPGNVNFIPAGGDSIRVDVADAAIEGTVAGYHGACDGLLDFSFNLQTVP